MRSIFSITRSKLEEYFLSIGEKKFKATQVFEWIYRKSDNIVFVDKVKPVKKLVMEM